MPLAVLAIGSLVIYLTGGWPGIFRFFGQPVTMSLLCCLFLIAGWLGLLAAGVVLGIAVLAKSPAEPKEPEPVEVDGIKWRWHPSIRGGLRVIAFCPHCDLQLQPAGVPRSFHALGSDIVYYCEHCKSEIARFNEPIEELHDRVGRLIQQKWRKAGP